MLWWDPVAAISFHGEALALKVFEREGCDSAHEEDEVVIGTVSNIVSWLVILFLQSDSRCVQASNGCSRRAMAPKRVLQALLRQLVTYKTY